MTKDDIIRMAHEAGLASYPGWVTDGEGLENLERFAALVAASEREAIAQMIEDAPTLVDFAKNELDGCLICGFTPNLFAATIRARALARLNKAAENNGEPL